MCRESYRNESRDEGQSWTLILKEPLEKKNKKTICVSKEWFSLDALAFETGKYIVPQRIKQVIVTHLGTDRVPPPGGGTQKDGGGAGATVQLVGGCAQDPAP